jgi:hypothetical protein
MLPATAKGILSAPAANNVLLVAGGFDERQREIFIEPLVDGML